jgi:hypothetical protein
MSPEQELEAILVEREMVDLEVIWQQIWQLRKEAQSTSQYSRNSSACPSSAASVAGH